MSEDRKYNGWTNYETWCVKLWLDNEQGTNEYWNEQAGDTFERADIRKETYWTRSEKARFDLADQLKDQINESSHETLNENAGLFRDLLSAALSEVNWNEIANAFLEECESREGEKYEYADI